LSTSQSDKIKPFRGLNFFYMGLSNRWGSEERTILRDCLHANHSGAKVYLYTYKDSVLSTRAQAEGIECLFHQGKFATKFYRWHRLRKLRQLISDLNINLVHCYDIKTLWPLCYYLRSLSLVPLVFTLGKDIRQYYRSFWFKPLVERIDQVFLSSSEQVENVWGHLGIPPRKTDFIGLGLETYNKDRPKPPYRFTEERFYIGTNLNGIETNTHFLDTVFHSFRVMIEKGLDEKNYTFALCNERPWNECVLTDELRRQVKDWGLEEHVAFVGPSDIVSDQFDIDLWLGLLRRESLEDYAVQALLAGKPVVIPRTTCSMELFQSHGQVGETYLTGDSRELREKCELILRNLSTYEKTLHQSFQGLTETYGQKRYEETLVKIYKKLLGRRRRLQRAKKKKARFLKRKKKA
jgi:glycosyltransferase involved in cell wall biosynthesis